MTFANAFTCCILVATSLMATAQKIDSLEAVLDTATADRKVKTLNELFRAHQQSDPVKALSYAHEALQLATDIDDKKGIAASYNNIGVSYRNQGALDKALEFYMHALKLYEELENKEGQATLKNNIANIYAMKKDYGQAMQYLEDSYNMFVTLKDDARVIGSMNNLGNLHLDLQLYEKAMKYYSEAYQLSVRSGDPFSDPLNNIGNIHFKQGNYQLAIEHYQQALELERRTNNKLGILNTITNIGIAYAKAGNAEAAQTYLNEAANLVEELHAYSYLPPILKYNADVLHKKGHSEQAYLTLLQYDSLKEKMFGEESTRKIAQMEMVLNFQEKEKQLELLQQEDKIKSLQLRNSRLFIVMVILAILVLLGIANFYFMGNRKKLFNRTQ